MFALTVSLYGGVRGLFQPSHQAVHVACGGEEELTLSVGEQ